MWQYLNIFKIKRQKGYFNSFLPLTSHTLSFTKCIFILLKNTHFYNSSQSTAS